MALVFPYIWIPNGGVGPVEIVSWADGTDEQIKAMIDAADAGKINIYHYWSIGDKRTVHLSAMPVDNAFSEGQPEQDVVLAIMDTGASSGYKNINSNKPVNFVWGQEDVLQNKGHLVKQEGSATAVYSTWRGCDMYNSLNNTYYNSLPIVFRNCLKPFNATTNEFYRESDEGSYQQRLDTSPNYICLFAEKEIYGENSNNKSNSIEQSVLSRIEYYESYANIPKKYSHWMRSPYNRIYGLIAGSGSSSYTGPAGNFGIAPFGCI